MSPFKLVPMPRFNQPTPCDPHDTTVSFSDRSSTSNRASSSDDACTLHVRRAARQSSQLPTL
ncbi:hypothetical protein CHLRE_03g155926v5 [Chlamydomonas reinhardtii]|uniref:Uncharacterized protein n=1 Tax=Chlamydomonas reinhardtii TaxID=3055 RepID=A0A2K3DW04_CHLRE|nr:uncharacterized protein CHLRE_03g155926v5 [Chlamydomonas reinhardtii]PNW84717.1 hypothetical protein CHLRE_03g155926v5 [Chlamydomonas reinhardtii]